MALPDSVVSRIFIRMTLRYGAAWIATLKGDEGDLSHAEWAHELTGTSVAAIDSALEALPDGAPPTIEQFKGLCVFSPCGATRRVRKNEGDPRAAAQALAKMAETRARVEDGKPRLKWAHDLRERERRGERLSEAMRSSWRAALGEPKDAVA